MKLNKKIETEVIKDGIRYCFKQESGKSVSVVDCYDYQREGFDWMLLANIFTVKSYRGKGLATKLIKRSYRDANRRHAGIYLLVKESNSSAIQLYKHIGFTTIKPYKMNGDTYLVMAKGRANKEQLIQMSFH